MLRFETLGRRVKIAAARSRSAAAGGSRRRAPWRAGGRAAARAMSLAELTDEQREIRDLARRFADEVVAPQAAAWDPEHRFPKEVLASSASSG